MVKTNIKTLIRGGGTPGGGGTVIKAGIDYISSPEFQQKAKAVATTVGLVTGVVTAVAGTEAGVCHLLDSTTPSYMILSSTVNGYYTSDPETRQRFREIRSLISDEDVRTFCKPNSNELDSKAVTRTFKKYRGWMDDYTDDSPVPILKGPHPAHPLEPKERAFEDFEDIGNYE